MTTAGETRHIAVLDGWRGVSILLVLAGHLFPIGPKQLELNGAVAAMGMAIFFTLSGFLITSFLLRRPDVRAFLIRRIARIVPLAWLATIVVLGILGATSSQWLAHLLFFGNLPPFLLLPVTGHFWSLCLEMQFYVGVALLVAVAGARGLSILPWLCVAVTVLRVVMQQPMVIVTWYRIDEILAGCALAIAFHRGAQRRLPGWVLRMPPALPLLGLLASCHPRAEPINYLRPYFASGAVGLTLFRGQGRIAGMLCHRALGYVARISYALYVLHPLLAHTWLGGGEVVERYLKRPLLVAALWAGAHVSTFFYEQRFIDWGHRWSSRKAAA